MRYLVAEITVNSNKPFKTLLPKVYCEDSHLPVTYLRTEMFHQNEVNFNYLQLSYKGRHGLQYVTGHNVYQPLNADVSDSDYYDTFIEVECTPLHPRSMVVEVDDAELSHLHTDLETEDEGCRQLIFEALLQYMPTEFVIHQITSL